MTTHRLLEPIALVLHSRGGARHVRRPRSQKGFAYCGALLGPIPAAGVEIVIQHPDKIPLEVRVERDFRNVCRRCARIFFTEVAGENPRLRWAGGDATVPIVWSEIFGRTGLTPAQISIVTDGIDFDKLERERVLSGTQMHSMYNPTPTAADIEADAERSAREALETEHEMQLVRESRIQETTDELEDPTTERDRTREHDRLPDEAGSYGDPRDA